LVVLARIAEMPPVVLLFLFVPIVNIVIAVLLPLRVAKAFGKGPLFGLGLLVLPSIFCPVLGFGRAEYRGIG